MRSGFWLPLGLRTCGGVACLALVFEQRCCRSKILLGSQKRSGRREGGDCATRHCTAPGGAIARVAHVVCSHGICCTCHEILLIILNFCLNAVINSYKLFLLRVHKNLFLV